MKKFWQNIKRQYLRYSRSDRNGILILAGFLLFSLLINKILDYLPSGKDTDFSQIKELMDDWSKELVLSSEESPPALFVFNPNEISEAELDSLDIPAQIKRNLISYRQAGGRFKNSADFRKIYGMNDSLYAALKQYVVIPAEKSKISLPKVQHARMLNLKYFDPNRVTLAELKSFGLSDYQASNLAGYRLNGGTFRKPDDLLRIYGIDSVIFMKLLPYVRIDSITEDTKDSPEIRLRIELNSADTSELISLPGIGTAYAKRIIRYRELLGGYHSPKQLLEVYNFPSETFSQIEGNLYTDTLKIKQLRINFADYSQLIRHPYLSKAQVTQILVRRERKGPFKSLAELEDLQGFDDGVIKRISPYITCR